MATIDEGTFTRGDEVEFDTTVGGTLHGRVIDPNQAGMVLVHVQSIRRPGSAYFMGTNAFPDWRVFASLLRKHSPTT